MGLVKQFSAAAWARVQKALLPPGKLWRLDDDSLLSRVFLAAGDELVRFDQRKADLVRERDPRLTDELLPEWEKMLGLPSTGTKDERRARIVARLVRRQRFRPVDFQQVLSSPLGLDPEDVAVIERSRAFAQLVDDDREIYRFFIHRDPGLAGSYSVADAQVELDKMKPTHTAGHVIESIDFKCDDPESLCDRDILGGDVFPLTQAELEAALGKEGALASHIYALDEDADLVDRVGADDLSVFGDPEQEVFSEALYTTGVKFEDDSSDELRAPNALTMDSGDSLAVLVSLAATGTPSGRMSIVSNREAGFGAGFMLRWAGQQVEYNFEDQAGNQITKGIAGDHVDGTRRDYLIVIDFASMKTEVHSDLGSSGSGAIGGGDYSSAQPGRLGNSPNRNAAPMIAGFMAVLKGAAAEGLNATHLANFRKWSLAI